MTTARPHFGDPDKPKKVTHVVMNTPNRAATAAYYCEAMNFRVIDETKLMTFLCAGTDHHCIALIQHSTVSLNHIAFETANIDAVMRGIGRLRENGVPVKWGAGRHSHGNNVFAYFIGPGGEIIEYTSEVMQVDDNYRVGTPERLGLSRWTIRPLVRHRRPHGELHGGAGQDSFREGDFSSA